MHVMVQEAANDRAQQETPGSVALRKLTKAMELSNEVYSLVNVRAP
jgi:hypothetical protein